MIALLRRAGLGLTVVLGLLAALGLARFTTELFGEQRLELGARHIASLDPELVALIQSGEAPLTAMLFLTSESDSPSERRGLEADLGELLGRLQGALPGRFQYGITDPAGDPDEQRFGARRGVTPFRELGARGDKSTARELYATLLFDWGPYGSARIEHIGPEHLPFLQAMIRARLEELLRPSRPHFVLLAPDASPFQELGAELTERGTLTRLDPTAADFDWQAVFAGDLVFWMSPGPEAAAALPELERLVDSGRALVVAGSPFGEPQSPGIRELLAGLGLTLSEAPVPIGESLANSTRDTRGAVLSIAPDQDFRHLTGQPNGDLHFLNPAGLAFDSVVLDRRASGARRLCSSRELEGRPKEALGVLLEPADARRGRIAAFGAATPFQDGSLSRPGTAHKTLVRVLVDSFGGADRRALLAALPLPARALPPASSGARLAMRAFVMLPLPLFLLALGLTRRTRRRAAEESSRHATHSPSLPGSKTPRILPQLAAGFVLALAATWLLESASAARWDWTRARLSEPAAITLEVARALGETQRAQNEAPLSIELFVSPPSKLPAGLTSLEARLRELLAPLTEAGLAVELDEVMPEDLSPEAREGLERAGIVPFRFDGPSGLGGAAGIERRMAWAGLRLTRPGAEPVVLPFESGSELDELEFRLALALERLHLGRTPKLGFASDLPRSSAAEDYEFQSKGNFAPREGDVFGRARRSLDRAGFEVVHINPRAQQAELELALEAADLDALLWLQPRRETRPMLEAFARYLVDGGRALLAAQHFRTQARQYRGAGYETVFWPQPQLIDVDRYWLGEFGVQLQREVRFDSLDARLPIATRVTGKSSETEFAPLVTRAPFLVRVPTAQFTGDALLAGVADLSLADPTAILLDAPRLEELGLTARPLFFGSPIAWRLDWQGGWLPPEVLAPPDTTLLDPEPLFGVVLEGRFPAPLAAWDDFEPQVEPHGDGAGRLILFGNSACFTDDQLGLAASGASALLLNAAADLGLADFGPRGPKLALLATRRPTVRGLGLVTDETRTRGRQFVLGGGALLVAASLLVRRAWRLRLARKWRATGERASVAREHRGPRQPLKLPWPAMLVTLLIGIVTFGATRAMAEDSAVARRGTLRFGRLVRPELRTTTVAALRLTAPEEMGGSSYTFGHQSGNGLDVWRELEGLGALGDPEAIVATIEDLFEAEGQVVGEGEELAEGLGFGAAWRVELFHPLDELPTDPAGITLAERLGEPHFVAEIGRASPDGRAAMVRILDQPAIWSIDRNPRYRIEGTLDKSAARERLRQAPPLSDRRLVPAVWPGRSAGLVTFAWQRAGEKSLRLTEVPMERSPEELQQGERPVAWRLVGEGVSELLELPPAQAPGSQPDPTSDGSTRPGALAESFLDFVARSEYAELLDPRDADNFGLGQGTTPWAILLFASRPTESQPNGTTFTITIGPPLPPELGGGHAAIHGASQNLVRLSRELVEAVLPARGTLLDPMSQRLWKQPR